MNMTTKMIIVLTVISMVAGGILSSWDNITRPKIEAYKLQELKKAIAEVLPAHEQYDEIKSDGMILYVGKNSNQTNPVGVAFEAVGNGFQGKISIMVGIDTAFSQINGIKILEQIETPGLGTKIVEDPTNKSDRFWFPNQFKQLKTDPQIDVVKNIKPTKPTEIQAITGATISSKAVATILNDQIRKAKSIYQSQTQ
ncbi:MAG: RnfABCDGE type electron transport complex subunit G [Calditrichales bacterium]|nr:MAG: RnfABCDGE type electron transport complex subunit G [Calditrichales bacterium]